MQYGGPCYSRNGEVELGFGSQKHFIGLYILRLDVLDAYRDLLTAKRRDLRQRRYPLFKAREDRLQDRGDDAERDPGINRRQLRS